MIPFALSVSDQQADICLPDKPKTSATLSLFIHIIYKFPVSHTHTIEDLPTETTEQLFHHQEQLTVCRMQRNKSIREFHITDK